MSLFKWFPVQKPVPPLVRRIESVLSVISWGRLIILESSLSLLGFWLYFKANPYRLCIIVVTLSFLKPLHIMRIFLYYHLGYLDLSLSTTRTLYRQFEGSRHHQTITVFLAFLETYSGNLDSGEDALRSVDPSELRYKGIRNLYWQCLAIILIAGGRVFEGEAALNRIPPEEESEFNPLLLAEIEARRGHLDRALRILNDFNHEADEIEASVAAEKAILVFRFKGMTNEAIDWVSYAQHRDPESLFALRATAHLDVELGRATPDTIQVLEQALDLPFPRLIGPSRAFAIFDLIRAREQIDSTTHCTELRDELAALPSGRNLLIRLENPWD